MKLFGNIIDGLHKNMDLRLLRQNIINTNIANIDTPGYKPKDLVFQDELAKFINMDEGKMAATSAKHYGAPPRFEDVQGEVITQAGELGPDQNEVDLDRQMAEMSSNAYHYRASAKIIHKRMALMKYVINETR